jgi:hypothetical protein
MTIHFHCACGQKLKASDASVGKHFDCPVCGTEVTVPAADEATPVAATVADAEARSEEPSAPVTAAAMAPKGRPEEDDDDADVFLASTREEDEGEDEGLADSDTQLMAAADTKELDVLDGRSNRRSEKAETKPSKDRVSSAPEVRLPPPPRPEPRPAPDYRRTYDAPVPAEAPRNGTSETAKDLVRLVREIKKDTKTEAERKKNDKRRTKEGRERLDYGLLFGELARTVLPGGVAIVLLCYLSYWLATTVMSGGRGWPELGDVSGVVTLDGVPVEGATVTFQPLPPEGEDQPSHVSASVGLTDKDGRYTLMYVQDAAGAAVGRHKVTISAPMPNGRERLPKRYNVMTELTSEVQAGSNDADFELKSK